MSIQTVLTSSTGTRYILEMFTDITNLINVSDKIQFSLYTAIAGTTSDIYSSITPAGYFKKDVPVVYKSNSINTNNIDTTLTTLNQSTQDYDLLGIKLFKQSTTEFVQNDGSINTEYSYTTEIYSDIVNNITQQQFLSSINNTDIVSVSLLESPINNIDNKTILINFDSETVYKLVLDLKKLIVGQVEEFVHEILFIIDKETILNDKVYNTNYNNVLFTNNRLDDIKNIDSIFELEDRLDYKINPTIYKEGLNVLDESDGESVNLFFDMSSKLEELYIKQYLSEYDKYFLSIKDIQLEKNIVDEFSLNTLKQLFLKNSNLVNTSYKGNIEGMKIVMNIFCQSTGYHLLALEPSPLLSNFVYRITSSLPKQYWISDIKDVVHPISWLDEYVYVDIIDNDNNLFYDFERREHIKSKEIPISYLDISNQERYHLYPVVFDLSIFEDYHRNSKFNFNTNEYTVDISGYNSPALFALLSDTDNFILDVDIDTQNQVINFNTDYTFVGIALEYIFKLYVHEPANKVLYQTTTSYEPSFSGSLPFNAEKFVIEVSLKNGDVLIDTVGSVYSNNNLLDVIDNFSIVGDSLIYEIAQFKSYTWSINDPTFQTINTITTATNSLDITSYASGDEIYLRLLYTDGYELTLTTFFTIP